jgi:uncharacterized membrane protein YuzA (DUF378 family)
MAKHIQMCFIITLLVIIGGLNWGLVGLGWLIGNPNLNVVHMILGFLPMQVEAIVYVLVGVAAVMSAVFMFSCKDCACQKMDK